MKAFRDGAIPPLAGVNSSDPRMHRDQHSRSHAYPRSVLPALDLEAAPPFVYQLLLLSSSRFSPEGGPAPPAGPTSVSSASSAAPGASDKHGMRLRVLRGVMDHFDGLDMDVGAVCDGEVVEVRSQPSPARMWSCGFWVVRMVLFMCVCII